MSGAEWIRCSMAARWLCLALLLVSTGSGIVHANRRGRRQAGSCMTSEGRAGSCRGLRSCPPLEQLLLEAKRGGSGARAALGRLRQETLRCPFTRSSPQVCCDTGGPSRQQPRGTTTPRPFVFAFPAQTTRRPQRFTTTPSRRTTRRPQRFSTTSNRRTTRRPQRFTTTPTRRTTRVPPNRGSPSGLSSLSQSTLPGEDVCGRRLFSSRIFGGQDAEIGSWPWAASVGYQRNGRGQVTWNCAATLITDKYLVTAAHCVSRLGSFRPVMVRLGELDFNREPDCLRDDPTTCADPHQDVPIARTTPHPQYRGPRNNAHADDIALIRLVRSVRFSEFIRPICLPLDLGRFRGDSDSASGLKVYAVGWGRSENSPDSFTPILQEVALRLAPGSDCENTYGRSGLRSLGRRLCVTGDKPGADTCNGDSGGPLMVPGRFGINWFLTGVTSFGPSTCGTKQAVYTRVHEYVDWIRNNIN